MMEGRCSPRLYAASEASMGHVDAAEIISVADIAAAVLGPDAATTAVIAKGGHGLPPRLRCHRRPPMLR
jgi:hypothetical protein